MPTMISEAGPAEGAADWQRLADRVLAGDGITREEALAETFIPTGGFNVC